MLSASPSAEFEDHEFPVHSVAIDTEGDVGAAGAEDGSVVVWNLLTQTSLYHYPCSPMKRPITAMKWIPLSGHHYEDVAHTLKQSGFTDKKLIVATADGKLLCLDAEGKLFSACQLEVALLCIDTDGRVVVGGGADGSVRVWQLQGGKMRELIKIPKAHSGAVTAIAIAEPEIPSPEVSGGAHNHHNQNVGRLSEMLVTGSDDCSIRVWRMAYDR